MQKISSTIKKLFQQYKEGLSLSPRYNYEKLMKALEWASYPAGLGAINLILYQYMNTIKIPPLWSPQTLFLLSSVLFFFLSILVGFAGLDYAKEEPLANKEELKKSNYRNSGVIVMIFLVALLFDFMGLMFLAYLSFY